MAMKPKKSEKPGTSRDYVRSYIGSEPRYETPKKTTPKLKNKASMNEAEMAREYTKFKKLQESRKYSPAPMTAAQKEKARRAGEKKSALIKMKNDPLVKGAKAILKSGASPVGIAAMAAGKAAGMYAKAGKAVAGAIKDKVSPPKRGTMSGKQLFPGQKKGGAKATPKNAGPRKTGPSKNGFTPKELEALRKMLSQGGRLDK